MFSGWNRVPIALGACFALVGTGCGSAMPWTRPGPQPVKSKETPAAVDVREHLSGMWWRVHQTRTQGFRLHANGDLELVGVPPLRGVAWRARGRALVLRMRSAAGDLYEDELYLRRLTNRTLVVEARDSYFAGTYKRRPADVTTAPDPSSRSPYPTGTPAAPTAAAPSDTTLERPIVLRRVRDESLPQRPPWQPYLDDLSECDEALNGNVCPRFYTDAPPSLLLVEICQDDRRLRRGIHVVDLLGNVESYPWFDEGFGRFACENACDSDGGCRYEVNAVTPTGKPTELTYRFEIASTWGWVRMALGPQGRVRVTESRIGQPDAASIR